MSYRTIFCSRALLTFFSANHFIKKISDGIIKLDAAKCRARSLNLTETGFYRPQLKNGEKIEFSPYRKTFV